jgi:hypothetical protein
MVVIAPAVAAAAINAGAGLFEGLLNRNKQQEANAILARSADFRAQQDAANNVMGMFGSLGSAQNAQYWGNVLSPDLDLSRQQKAEQYKLGFLDPKQAAMDREFGRAELDFRNSPAYRELQSRLGVQTTKNNIAEQRAEKAGMFGQISYPSFDSFRV